MKYLCEHLTEVERDNAVKMTDTQSNRLLLWWLQAATEDESDPRDSYARIKRAQELLALRIASEVRG